MTVPPPLADLASPELAASSGRVLVLPLGSCEQHGPHLPLGTDTIIATELADRLAERRPDVVVAPALAISASGEHAGFPGAGDPTRAHMDLRGTGEPASESG